MAISNVYNRDCLEAMKEFPDNFFELSIVDPPYGIGMDGTIGIGIGKEKGFTRKKEYTKKNWDKEVPSQEYFDELFRVSKNQIVWGANYFTKQLPVIKNYIFWHKKGQSVDNKFNDGEMAFTSLGRTRMIDIWWNGVGVINSGENKIHPTQKPVALYKWLLQNYAKEIKCDVCIGSGEIESLSIDCDVKTCNRCKGNGTIKPKILDTHLGSGSSRIACHDMGFDFWGYELDKDYFEAMEKRFQNHIKQPSLFSPQEMYHQTEIK